MRIILFLHNWAKRALILFLLSLHLVFYYVYLCVDRVSGLIGCPEPENNTTLLYYWLVGKYASQNPCVGLAYSWKEIYVGNLQQLFTETRLGDVDLSKTQPCKYFLLWTKEIQATKTAIY